MKKGKKYPHLQRARIGRCATCGAQFRAVKDCKERRQKYCNQICWATRSPAPQKKCVGCGNEFRHHERVYCTKQCRDTHYRTRFKGAKSHLWEGGKTAYSKIIRTSAAYRDWRMAVFERDRFRCVDCGSNTHLQADHIKPLAHYPELAYQVENGRTLCRPCHKLTDTWAWKGRWRFKRWEIATGKEAIKQ